MKKKLKGFCLMVGVLALFACQEYENVEIEDISLASAQDGDYSGEYAIMPVKVKVQVKIKDNQIADIKLLQHRCKKGIKANNIIETVLDQQTLQVDAISGATCSSKTILKAIEQALKKSEAK